MIRFGINNIPILQMVISANCQHNYEHAHLKNTFNGYFEYALYMEMSDLYFSACHLEKLEDTIGVITSCKSKDRQHKDHKKNKR